VNKKENCFGICEWYMGLSGPSAVRIASALGLDGIQLGDLGGAAQNFPLLDPFIQEQYLQAAAGGAVLHSLHTFTLTREGGMRYPMNSAQGESAVHSFRQGLKACEALHIPVIMVASFDASHVRNDYDMENTGKMLKHFAQLSKDSGVQLTYEAAAVLTDRQLWLLDYVGEGLKLCYDTLNPLRNGSGDPQVEIPRFGIDRIDHIHVKDAPADMIGCCPVGEGAGRVSSTINLAKKLGYRGWYFLENYYYLPPMNQMGFGTDLMKKDLRALKLMLEGE
jgi:sugar phosphate isomerase/epimerase